MRLSRIALAALAAACTFTSTAHAAFEKGPAPSITSLRANAGPYAVSKTTYANSVTPGFGAATVYAPSNAAGQTFGAVAFAPGWTESQSVVTWLAQRAASFGFVTIAFDVNNTFADFPAARAPQLLAALDFVTSTAKERTSVDPARLAVAGHSMGGGATLEAARTRPSLKATVGLAPWNPGITYGDVTVPSLEVGAQNDFIAGVNNNARLFYTSLPATTPKVYTEFSGLGHLGTNSPSARVGAATIAWLKRYVDEDTRYTPFICGSHAAIANSELSAFASNC